MTQKRKNLGPAFPDGLDRIIGRPNKKNKAIEADWKDTLLPNFQTSFGEKFTKNSWAIFPFYLLTIILFFVLFLRLFHLQIIEGKASRELADGNRIQVRVIHAQRGVIFDRNDKILAANSPAFRLFDNKSKKAKLITREEALKMEVNSDPKWINLEVDNVRNYQLGEEFAHVIGYVGEISENQLKMGEYKNYRLGDRVGQYGIELEYEKLLRGIDGGEIIEVNSSGVKLRTLRRNPPIPGKNIKLTIDADLQKKLYENLKLSLEKNGSCCGAAIAMDPKNGQILALVSYPSFNPNVFTSGYDEDAISGIFTNSNSPILNRAIAGTYPPGSTFKIISSLAALESGKITPSTIVQDTGVIYLGAFSFSNWYFTEYGKTEGSVDLLKAIQRSNDIYYYHVGQTIGEEVLIEWSRKLNLGRKLGIDLSNEANGLIPDDEWKRENTGEGWYPGDTLHMAIGQGFVLTTPLQILGITSFMASDGILYKPQLLLTNFKPKVLIENITSLEKIKVIKKGLELVPKNGGTAWPFFTFPIKTAGKTGTAEFGDVKNRTHGWYTAYAPSEDPKIAITVLVEGGGEGSNVAAPVVKEAFRYYLSEDKNNLIKDVYNISTDSAKTLGE